MARFIPLLGSSVSLLLLCLRDWSKEKILIATYFILASINLSFFIIKAGWSSFVVSHGITEHAKMITEKAAGRSVGVSPNQDLSLYIYELLKEQGIKVRFQECGHEEYMTLYYNDVKLCWADE